MSKALVLISDFKLASAVRLMLSHKGFDVTIVANVELAMNMLTEIHFSVLIIDTQERPESAFEFVKDIRRDSLFTPILYLGETTQEEILRKECTPLDEYVLRPLTYDSIARGLGVVLIKAHSPQRPLLYRGINIDEMGRRLISKDRSVVLGRLEMKIFALLAKRAGQVVTVDKIYSLIEQEGVKLNYRIFRHVTNLRTKLEYAGMRDLKINFVNDGYRLDVI